MTKYFNLVPSAVPTPTRCFGRQVHSADELASLFNMQNWILPERAKEIFFVVGLVLNFIHFIQKRLSDKCLFFI